MRARRSVRPLAALAMSFALVLASAACSSSDDTSATKSTGKTEIGDAANVSSTTADDGTTAPPTTVVPSSPSGLDTPEAAAARLYSAWKAGDRGSAQTVAEPMAIDAVFTAAPGEYKPYGDCDSGELAESGCLYRGDAGTIQFTMEKRNNLWVVISAFYAA